MKYPLDWLNATQDAIDILRAKFGRNDILVGSAAANILYSAYLRLERQVQEYLTGDDQ